MKKISLVLILSLSLVITFTFMINKINPYKMKIVTFEVTTENINEETIEEEVIKETILSVPLIKKQLTMNYSVGTVIKPQYLVIHETANTKVGANANAHYRYWSTNPSANASTHFVVDDQEIYQILELNQMGWHVGDNKVYSDITNRNSIGMEIAVNSDGDFMKARQNAIELTIKIMKELNMSIDQLKRHHDASGKYCPTNMLNNDYLWNDFVNQVKKAIN